MIAFKKKKLAIVNASLDSNKKDLGLFSSEEAGAELLLKCANKPLDYSLTYFPVEVEAERVEDYKLAAKVDTSVRNKIITY